MARATPATRALDKLGIPYSLHAYAYDPEAPRIGLQAAEALGVGPDRVIKTLMAAVDGKPVCLLVASDREVSMKRVAAAFGGKAAAMLKVPDAERLTGYHVGGISPLGQRRAVPTVVDAGSLATDQAIREDVYVNGGGRGLQLRVRPDDLLRALGARTAALT